MLQKSSNVAALKSFLSLEQPRKMALGKCTSTASKLRSQTRC
ncbi:hypothetical protein M3J09_008432 [Ascochyta lentis]